MHVTKSGRNDRLPRRTPELRTKAQPSYEIHADRYSTPKSIEYGQNDRKDECQALKSGGLRLSQIPKCESDNDDQSQELHHLEQLIAMRMLEPNPNAVEKADKWI